MARTIVVSVKDTNGDWTTLKAIEVRIPQPIVMSEDKEQLIFTGKINE